MKLEEGGQAVQRVELSACGCDSACRRRAQCSLFTRCSHQKVTNQNDTASSLHIWSFCVQKFIQTFQTGKYTPLKCVPPSHTHTHTNSPLMLQLIPNRLPVYLQYAFSIPLHTSSSPQNTPSTPTTHLLDTHETLPAHLQHTWTPTKHSQHTHNTPPGHPQNTPCTPTTHLDTHKTLPSHLEHLLDTHKTLPAHLQHTSCAPTKNSQYT